ncbi:prolyl oligopeptidase family protein [Novosphingobium sp. 9U]|uniref:prolyl oligopeptidase family serine peptidase n=1 Tax=Novosphingobium sp. 9U TaxID=2653158 RepID=UPI0012F0E6D6|nr:prolyl oligopeptidase family serine peptidase [Novosphingobium sp. 9U]VWX54728.1 Prolyl endopeptidase [Novosphingobium sp. 9U]
MTVTALATSPTRADTMKMNYPATRREPLVEQHFGEAIADPYRWLENDVRSDKEVAGWVERENAVTRQYLDTLPQRGWFAAKIRELIDYERFGLPTKAGGRYFYTRNSGLQNQAQLFVREGLHGEPRLLLDPNSWAKDGATALDGWKPSDDGKHLLFSVQDGGSDWRVLHVLDVATGKQLPDEVKWAKFTDLAWAGADGFVYSRFPAPAEGTAFQGRNYDHAVYYHRLGTPQEADQLVFATPEQRDMNHDADVTQDGRYLVIRSSTGTDSRQQVRYVDLQRRTRDGWNPRTLVAEPTNDWKLVASTGTRLWFVTNKDAPRYKLVVIDLAERAPQFRQVVAERDELLERATIIGNHLILNYLKDAASHAEIVGLDGKSVRDLTLAGLGTASGFDGKPGDPETFYSYSSFNQPAAVFRMDIATGKSEPFAQPAIKFDPAKYLIEQRFYTSKDGTKVPMFVVRSKAAAAAGKAQPTLLYGYGGFDISLTPGYSAVRMAWLEAGGAFAMANLRGGGEYGKAWHDAGRLANKQNVFDDFIAAGEYLIAQGITPKDGLSIQGGSNGGLLVGAVVNQRPDLFAAANAAVGVMDMLRFDRFTAGRYWVDDYGYPEKEADFRVLRKYSPYHNIRSGVDYPAVLVTTADTDDRVVPGHSFKYTAALQQAQAGPKPHLIRIETRAGHGSGKPTDKVIDEGADVLSFLAKWSGLETPAQ